MCSPGCFALDAGSANPVPHLLSFQPSSLRLTCSWAEGAPQAETVQCAAAAALTSSGELAFLALVSLLPIRWYDGSSCL